MLAPAEVPATTAPALVGRDDRVAERRAADDRDSLSWLPPVMKTPVALSSAATSAGSWASSRRLRPDRDHLGGAQPRNSASYTSTTSSPSEDAVGITAIRASGPPLAATNSLRIVRRRSLSSAPPMIMRGPLRHERATLSG